MTSYYKNMNLFQTMNEAKHPKASAQYGPSKDDRDEMVPRRQSEIDFVELHDVEINDHPYDSAQDGAEKIKQAPPRRGDMRNSEKRVDFEKIKEMLNVNEAKRRYVGGGGKKAGEDKNIIMQLRHAQDLDGNHELTFRRGKEKVDKATIDKVLAFHDRLQKPEDKRRLRIMITQSPEALKKAASMIPR